jgi:hypothetical protein
MTYRYACLLIPMFTRAMCTALILLATLKFAANVPSSTDPSLTTLTTYLLEHCLQSSYVRNHTYLPYFMACRGIVLLSADTEARPRHGLCVVAGCRSCHDWLGL